MKTILLPAVVAALVAATTFSAPRAHAQAQPPAAAAQPRAASGPQIAVVDLNKIFKEHAKFLSMKDDMKRDVDQAESEVKAMRDEIQKLAQVLEERKPGSPDYKELESQLASRQAQLQAKVQLLKKDFMMQEAKIYHQIYREVNDEIRSYADRMGITLVLRISDEQIDDNDPQAVLEELKKSVVHHHPTVNITPVILQAINRRYGAAPQQQAGAGQPAGRPAAAAPPAGKAPANVGARPPAANPPRTR